MKLARAIGYCLLAISAVYFLVAAWRYADELPPIVWNALVPATFAAVMLLYLFQFLLGGIAWHLWLSSVREPSRPSVAVALVALSQFAKYIPGSIAHHIARVALGRRYGLGTPGMVITIALEQGWAVIAGVAITVASAVFMGPAAIGMDIPSPLRIALVVLVALAGGRRLAGRGKTAGHHGSLARSTAYHAPRRRHAPQLLRAVLRQSVALGMER